MVRGLIGYWADPLATRAGRLLSFFLLYVSEGIPLGFTATVIATHMRREGLDPAVIGAYVGSLYLPWAFKWVFGPIIDTITSDRFGRRRELDRRRAARDDAGAACGDADRFRDGHRVSSQR